MTEEAVTILAFVAIGVFALGLVWNFILRWKRGHLGRPGTGNNGYYQDMGPYGDN